jgi:hypothetical protein
VELILRGTLYCLYSTGAVLILKGVPLQTDTGVRPRGGNSSLRDLVNYLSVGVHKETLAKLSASLLADCP